MYIYSESVFNLLPGIASWYQIKTKCEKTLLSTKSVIWVPTKKSFFFFCKLQLITVLLLNFYAYMGCSTRFVSLKTVGFFIFDFVSFLLKFSYLASYFFQQNAWAL